MSVYIAPSPRAQGMDRMSGTMGDGTLYEFAQLNIPQWHTPQGQKQPRPGVVDTHSIQNLRNYVRSLPVQAWIAMSYVGDGTGLVEPFTRRLGTDGFDAQGDDYFNCTMFPVVWRRVKMLKGRDGKAYPEVKIFVAPYLCVYSSFPLSDRDNEHPSDSFQALAQLGIGLTANYVQHTTQPPRQSRVSIDEGLIKDTNAGLAIIAALENSNPRTGSYITFAPLFNDPSFLQRLREATESPHQHEVYGLAGPSMGLAVYAAVLGAAPVMYTGYNSYIFPNTRIASSKDFSQISGTGDGSGMSATRFALGSAALPMVTVGADFVDDVAEMPIKTMYALAVAYPIVIPYQSSMGHPIWQVAAATDMGKIHPTLGAGDLFFTMSNVLDGATILPHIKPLLVAPTITEAVLLAGIAFTALQYVQATLPLNIGGGVDSTGALYVQSRLVKRQKGKVKRAEKKAGKKELGSVAAYRRKVIEDKAMDAQDKMDARVEAALARISNPRPAGASVKKKVAQLIIPRQTLARMRRDQAIADARPVKEKAPKEPKGTKKYTFTLDQLNAMGVAPPAQSKATKSTKAKAAKPKIAPADLERLLATQASAPIQSNLLNAAQSMARMEALRSGKIATNVPKQARTDQASMRQRNADDEMERLFSPLKRTARQPTGDDDG